MVELIWTGKYGSDGKRIAPLRVKLPFQTVETINASAQQRQMSLDFASAGKSSEWRNRLIWGDKKYVLPSLLDEFAGKVDLIYIDPPFATGDNFTFQMSIEGTQFLKEANAIEQKAYRDTWGRDLNTYMVWIYETATYLRELLSPTGSVYIHCDWHVGHYIKTILDEVFGIKNFRNQIVWQRFNFHADANRYGIVSDEILFYSASNEITWNPQVVPLKESYIESHFRSTDEKGRQYKMADILAKGQGPARKFGDRVLEPPAGTHWRFGQEKIDELMGQGRIVFTKNGRPAVKLFLDEKEGSVVHNIWNDIPPVNPMAKERVEYPTQKPEALLERIINTSSNEGDLVLDCFVGSGTTAATAEKLNRRWIACDLGRFSIHTTRKRILGISGVKPFVVQNLGKYERQTWQSYEFGGKKKAELVQAEYRNFILELYSARSIDGYVWLHGIKDGRMVHVGAVDSPISPNDITQIAIEFKKTVGTGKDAPKQSTVDILGWDFAFEINELGIKQAEEAGIKLRCFKIPRDVMDPKAVEQGDVKFFELAALSVSLKQKKQDLSLELTDFTIPPDDVPEEVQKAITHWSQWIDYWAVDWDNKGDTFHNQWQTYRTKQNPKLVLKAIHTYEQPGDHVVMVKVIDILGNDTTKTLKVRA